MDMFKEIIFTPRIIAFNESFVPLGKKSHIHPWAALWHEAISGRTKDNIISTFYAFLLENRDRTSVTIWLDNCSSQNKSWSLICFFLYFVNSSETAVEKITIKYFQPGHTFMSADAFHHQVEQFLRRNKKVYDFYDFMNVVKQSNSSNVNIIEMTLNRFYTFVDYTSKYKLKNVEKRVYLKDIVSLCFKRGYTCIYYKKEFDDEFTELQDPLKKKFSKTDAFTKPTVRSKHCGVSLERKTSLIAKLKSHIPINRMKFWEELSVSDTNNDDGDLDEY